MNRALYVQRQPFSPLSRVLLKYYFFCRSGCFHRLFIIAYCYRTLRTETRQFRLYFTLKDFADPYHVFIRTNKIDKYFDI